MSKIVIIVAFVSCAVALPDHILQYGSVNVVTTGGTLRGTTYSCGFRCTYYSFKGIPYAQPPIGDLRFRAPLPHSGWDGIRDAYQHGPTCPSNVVIDRNNQNENCLFLNVYTQNVIGSMPVMVYFHGGSFAGQSGNSFIYGPEYIIEEGVVLVTLNYRLGSLGFLSTGDNNAPGNYGLKDGVLALKWVRDNIKGFGGDPNRVTIFGQSAGGAYVHYLILSPVAKGLFNRAISQSGSALNPWAYQTNPVEQAHNYAKRLNINFTDNGDLVKQLREIDYKELIKATPDFMEYPIPRGHQPFPFVPARDPMDVDSTERFLPDAPLELILCGYFNHVPYIIGFNDGESLFSIHELRRDPQVFEVLNNNPHLFIPSNWNVQENSTEAEDIIQKIRDLYFRSSALHNDLQYEYTQYNTDVLFAHGIDQAARLHADVQKSKNPVYYYRFSFVGSMNVIKTVLLLNKYPGAVHGDDLFYLFKVTQMPAPLFPSNTALAIRRRMVRMWANFARNGNPTPEIDVTTWNPISERKQQFLNIDEDMVMSEHPFAERMNFWDELEATYNTLELD